MTATVAPLRTLSKPIYTGRHDFERHCADEIMAAVLAGHELACDGYSADVADFARVASERPDFALMLHGLVTGDLTPGLFQAYAIECLQAYADRCKGSRADYLESGAADHAEYLRDTMGDR
jgi:hypothetical protein